MDQFWDESLHYPAATTQQPGVVGKRDFISAIDHEGVFTVQEALSELRM